ncbi:MAG: MGMT family protein [Sphingobacteriales bacterium]|nr:MGMT family protein [Sphingobacteriales bacterium]
MKKKTVSKKIPVKKSVQTDPLTGKRIKGESFFADVYDVVRQIPRGRVTSYGAIANYLGTKSSARMVGWAMNGSHLITPSVPAHRVVNRLGMLSGKAHFNPPSKMEALLLKEGIKIKKDSIVDFEKYFWDPATELGL